MQLFWETRQNSTFEVEKIVPEMDKVRVMDGLDFFTTQVRKENKPKDINFTESWNDGTHDSEQT